MADIPDGEVTRLLDAIRAGDESAHQELIQLVYDELRHCAANLMGRERRGHSWQPTDLLNEAYLRLREQDALRKSPNGRHFFGVAVTAMRQLLVEHARQRGTARRGGGRQRVPLDDLVDCLEQKILDSNIVDLHEALGKLAVRHARASQVIELRFFGGCTLGETAEQLELSVSTVEREFRFARAWLHQHLKGDTP